MGTACTDRTIPLIIHHLPSDCKHSFSLRPSPLLFIQLKNIDIFYRFVVYNAEKMRYTILAQPVSHYTIQEVHDIMLEESFYRKTDEIISRYVREARSLIPIMQDIQAEYRYLPPELLSYVAEQIGITEAKAYSVATFYENFSFEAKGKYVIKVCDGTACHVRHSTPVLEALWKELGLSKKKHTTDDMLFTVETVSCLGACGLAPTMMVNEQVYPSMTPEKALAVIAELRGKG